MRSQLQTVEPAHPPGGGLRAAARRAGLAGRAARGQRASSHRLSRRTRAPDKRWTCPAPSTRPRSARGRCGCSARYIATGAFVLWRRPGRWPRCRMPRSGSRADSRPAGRQVAPCGWSGSTLPTWVSTSASKASAQDRRRPVRKSDHLSTYRDRWKRFFKYPGAQPGPVERQPRRGPTSSRWRRPEPIPGMINQVHAHPRTSPPSSLPQVKAGCAAPTAE
jgi:hypothetical protein